MTYDKNTICQYGCTIHIVLNKGGIYSCIPLLQPPSKETQFECGVLNMFSFSFVFDSTNSISGGTEIYELNCQ